MPEPIICAFSLKCSFLLFSASFLTYVLLCRKRSRMPTSDFPRSGIQICTKTRRRARLGSSRSERRTKFSPIRQRGKPTTRRSALVDRTQISTRARASFQVRNESWKEKSQKSPSLGFFYVKDLKWEMKYNWNLLQSEEVLTNTSVGIIV